MNDEQPLQASETVLGQVVRDAMFDAQMDVTDHARVNALVHGIFNGLAQEAR